MQHYRVLQGRTFYGGLLEALVQGMGRANPYLSHHGPNMAILSHTLGRSLELGEVEQARLFFASLLADVGMIGLVEEAWENPVEVLPRDARAEVRRHPRRSAEAIHVMPHLDGVVPLVEHHHEWWDGSGYPAGLRGEEIPLGARILRLADTVTALGQDRPQRPARSPSEIRAVVEQASGREFDPDLARLWLDLDEQEKLPSFHLGRYLSVRQRAIDALVPSDVASSSSEVLLELFSTLIDAKDPYTGGHSRRVALLASALGGSLELDDEVQEHLLAAGHLHDLGKLSVPSTVLRKPSGLEPPELEAVRSHAAAGADLVEEIPVLRPFAPACRHHHERWDGTGYPEGLAGERIPRIPRVLAVCDAYDAMTSARAYRPARTPDEALAEIRAQAGRQFGPEETEAFLSLPRAFLERVGEVGRGDRPGRLTPAPELETPRFRRPRRSSPAPPP